MQEDNEEQV